MNIKLLFTLLLIIFIPLFFPGKVFAQNYNNSYITIVNPVRISEYVKDERLSLQAEYEEVAERNFPATWLLTYDVMNSKDLMSVINYMNDEQEFGIFLEVMPNFAASAGVVYHDTGSWHHANSVFLSGYTQEERRKLIDTVFEKFKTTFGYTPVSVGAWWVDAFSLEYMKNKYGITGTLGVSDQYDLDGYQVWGTPWSTPYYPSKINAALPASTLSNKLDVVSFRWAHRDPLNGYFGLNNHGGSLYSTQDYPLVGLKDDYFEKMLGVYLSQTSNEFSQITVGLESDNSQEAFSTYYVTWLNYVSKFQAQGAKVINMKEFAQFYMNKYKNLSPQNVIYTKDILGTSKEIYWITTLRYRIGLLHDLKNNNTSVIDFRTYPDNLEEPFYLLSNSDYGLSINLPYVIDYVVDKKSAWNFNSGEIISSGKTEEGYQVKFAKGQINFLNNSIEIFGFNVPDVIKNSNLVSYNSNGQISKIIPKKSFDVLSKGLLIQDYSFNIPFTIEYKIGQYRVLIALISILILVLLFKLFGIKKTLTAGFAIIISGLSLYFVFQINNKYFVSQTEFDALSVLKRLPRGKVLVYDKDCLKCTFPTEKPAAAAGRKSYVGKFSGKEILPDLTFATAKNSKIAREFIKDNSINYIYLAKYPGYIESLPYIPFDLGVERVYQNGNAEIWKVIRYY